MIKHNRFYLRLKFWILKNLIEDWLIESMYPNFMRELIAKLTGFLIEMHVYA